MSQDKQEKHPITKFDRTVLLEIKPGKSTLPIDTSAEWTKGMELVNQLIYELYEDTYVESFVDEVGEKRRQTHVHPQLLPFIKERNKMILEIFRMLGGEAVIEGKKQAMRNLADHIFELGKDAKAREEHKDEIKQIIEAEFDDEFDGTNN